MKLSCSSTIDGHLTTHTDGTVVPEIVRSVAGKCPGYRKCARIREGRITVHNECTGLKYARIVYTSLCIDGELSRRPKRSVVDQGTISGIAARCDLTVVCYDHIVIDAQVIPNPSTTSKNNDLLTCNPIEVHVSSRNGSTNDERTACHRDSPCIVSPRKTNLLTRIYAEALVGIDCLRATGATYR